MSAARRAFREKLGSTEPWVEKGGVHWLTPECVERARTGHGDERRSRPASSPSPPISCPARRAFAWSITGTSTASCWAFPFMLAGNSIESIYDLCEAADWIEREIHEGFAIDFTGREYEPLLLRQGDKPGVNLREEDEMSYKIPMGPYHPALEEPYKLDLICEGETVMRRQAAYRLQLSRHRAPGRDAATTFR